MSHFYAKINNYRSRTKCTRRGFRESGMEATVQGWHSGARIEIRHENGLDIVRVYETNGANGSTEKVIYERKTA